MNLARILYPVRVLGPGERIGLWVCGCSRACPGCSNPELWHRRPEYEISVENAAALIRQISESHPVDGLTISGGEPFAQAGELADLIETSGITDILIYTGYQISELRVMHDPDVDRLLASAAVVIDGPYREELNDGSPIRGSSNQTVNLLSDRYRPLYEQYLAETDNRIQNFTTTDGTVSVGIHRPGFQTNLRR